MLLFDYFLDRCESLYCWGNLGHHSVVNKQNVCFNSWASEVLMSRFWHQLSKIIVGCSWIFTVTRVVSVLSSNSSLAKLFLQMKFKAGVTHPSIVVVHTYWLFYSHCFIVVLRKGFWQLTAANCSVHLTLDRCFKWCYLWTNVKPPWHTPSSEHIEGS